MVMCVEAHSRHAWLRHAVEPRLHEALAVLHVTSNAEKSRTVDLARSATCSVLGRDCRRVKSRRGAWRPWDTPRRWRYDTLRLCNNSRVRRPQPKALPVREVLSPFTRTTQASAVRENRTRRLTWRELEPWP